MTHLYSASSISSDASPADIFESLSHQVEAIRARLVRMGEAALEIVPGSLTLGFGEIGDPDAPIEALVLEATVVEHKVITPDNVEAVFHD